MIKSLKFDVLFLCAIAVISLIRFFVRFSFTFTTWKDRYNDIDMIRLNFLIFVISKTKFSFIYRKLIFHSFFFFSFLLYLFSHTLHMLQDEESVYTHGREYEWGYSSKYHAVTKKMNGSSTTNAKKAKVLKVFLFP